MAVDSRQFKVWLLGYLIHLFWGTEVLAKQTKNSGSNVISMTVFVLPGCVQIILCVSILRVFTSFFKAERGGAGCVAFLCAFVFLSLLEKWNLARPQWKYKWTR